MGTHAKHHAHRAAPSHCQWHSTWFCVCHWQWRPLVWPVAMTLTTDSSGCQRERRLTSLIRVMMSDFKLQTEFQTRMERGRLRSQVQARYGTALRMDSLWIPGRWFRRQRLHAHIKCAPRSCTWAPALGHAFPNHWHWFHGPSAQFGRLCCATPIYSSVARFKPVDTSEVAQAAM